MSAASPPGRVLIRLLAAIVPGRRRAEWEAEWSAELEHSWKSLERRGAAGALARAALLARCFGALPDALWLRRRHGGGLMLGQGLRYAARTIGRRPGFGTVVVLTLALGIGANTAIFSVVNGVLLQQLPYADPERLVMLLGAPTPGGDSTKVGSWTSVPDFLDIRQQTRSFARLAALRSADVTLTGPGVEPARLDAAIATSNLFATLGVSPALGRGFLAEEERPGGGRVAVLGHKLWRSRFGGDRAVLGRSVTIDGDPHTVVGVMPADSAFPSSAQIWLPLVPQSPLDLRGKHMLRVVGRLAPAVTRQRAEAEVVAVARRLEQQYPADNAQRSARLEPMREAVVGRARPVLLVLLGAVGIVLLICCANVANLFLARASTRAREVAVRAALGAGGLRLLRQFVAESLLLTLAGGVAGLLLAWWGVGALVAAAPSGLPRVSEIGIDRTVLASALALSVATGVAFGVIPAAGLARALTLGALRDGPRSATTGAGRGVLRQLLVVSEVALATVLTVGAALLVESLRKLQRVDPGFEARNVLAVHLHLPETQYRDRNRLRAFYDEARFRVAGLPGVRSVAVAYEHPLSAGWTTSFIVAGRQPPAEGLEPEARMRPVAPGYFRTMGVRLRRGRDITASDGARAPGVVVINEAFARKHFPDEDPVGKRLLRRPWWPEMPSSFEIVGVAADERFLGPREEPDPATYFPVSQFPFNEMYLLVRTANDPLRLAPAVRRKLWELDRDLPLDDVQTMRQLLDASVAPQRFNASLVTIFAALALALAAVGIYGVLSFTVAQRSSEIGIRMALGAQRARVLRLVVGQGMLLVLLGLAAGLAAALGATRVLASLVFGVRTTDPAIFARVTALLAAVALLAAYLPARRASRVDPALALRGE